MNLITSDEQRAIELAAVAAGQSILQMSQNAGAAVATALKMTQRVAGIPVAVLCGRGGNGGDGFVIARLLRAAGANAVILLCDGLPANESAAKLLDEAKATGVPVLGPDVRPERLAAVVRDADLIVDAVYGIGFSGEIQPALAGIFQAANEAKARIFAVDVPSGVDADRGIAASGAIEADTTYCLIGFKAAHVMKSAARFCGSLVSLDIGLPKGVEKAAGGALRILTAELAANLLPVRRQDAHKYEFGQMILAVGSDRYRGAAVLAAQGALAAGAGIIGVASTERTLSAVAAHCPEAILYDLRVDAGLSVALNKADAAVVGCGLMSSAESEALVLRVLKETTGSVVVDAGGINALANNIDIIANRPAPMILTPHVGEFAALILKEPAAVYADRITLARAFAAEQGAVVVLKSDNTVVALPNGDLYLNVLGNSGLAKGGSGDLLSGVIGALCAQDLSAEEASLLGVYLHSLAADIAASQMPEQAMTASIVANFLPAAIAQLMSKAGQK